MDPIRSAQDILSNRKPTAIPNKETARKATGRLRMAQDQLLFSPQAIETPKDENKAEIPTPQEVIDPIKKVNKVRETISDISKVATASGEVLDDLTKKIDAPVKGRGLGLRDAVIDGDTTGIVKEIASDTPVGHSLGLYKNVLQGDLMQKWDKAAEVSEDPNASFADKAMASLDATATTADTYQMVSKLSEGAAIFVERNWTQANRSLGSLSDIAAFAGQLRDDTAKGISNFFKDLPTDVMEGLKGNRGGIADVARGAETAGQTAVRSASRFAVGVNVAFAAYDVYHAGKVLDSEGSALQKGLAVTTAVGSVIAATNIPGLSQVGAAISFASSIAEVSAGHKEEKAVKSSISWGTT